MFAPTVRIIVLVATGLLFGAVCRVLVDGRRSGMSYTQLMRFASYIIADSLIAGLTLTHRHLGVTWDLVMSVAFLALALPGAWAMRSGRDRVRHSHSR